MRTDLWVIGLKANLSFSPSSFRFNYIQTCLNFAITFVVRKDRVIANPSELLFFALVMRRSRVGEEQLDLQMRGQLFSNTFLTGNDMTLDDAI